MRKDHIETCLDIARPIPDSALNFAPCSPNICLMDIRHFLKLARTSTTLSAPRADCALLNGSHSMLQTIHSVHFCSLRRSVQQNRASECSGNRKPSRTGETAYSRGSLNSHEHTTSLRLADCLGQSIMLRTVYTTSGHPPRVRARQKVTATLRTKQGRKDEFYAKSDNFSERKVRYM